MPANVVKPGTEAKWDAAKKAAGKQLKPGTPRYWSLVNYIYGKMVHRKETAADDGAKGGYLVTEHKNGKTVQHLPTTKNGKPDHGLMGGAWAALHGGYRGNKYEGPGKQQAIAKLKALYKREGMKTPSEQQAASALVRAARAVLKVFGTADEGFKEEGESLVSTCAVAIPGDDEPPEWIEVIPAGTFKATDGRGPFSNSEPDEIVRASIAKMPRAGMVLDYDHSTDLAAPEGRPSPAAGWIKELAVRGGAIFARIEWTRDAAEKVKEKLYRYISPVFEHSKDGTVERILRAALTNNPALPQLPAIAHAQGKTIQIMKRMSLSEMARRFEAALPKREDEEDMAYNARVLKHLSLANSTDAYGIEIEPTDGDDGDGSGDDGSDDRDDTSPIDIQKGEQPDDSDDTEQSSKVGSPEWKAEEEKEPQHQDEDEEQMRARHASEMATCPMGRREEMARRHEEEMAALMAKKEDMAKREEAGATTTAAARNKHREQNAVPKSVTRMIKERESKELMAVRAALVEQNETIKQSRAIIAQMQAERDKDLAAKTVDATIRAGRLLPVQRDWALEYATKDLAGFQKYAASAATMLTPGADGRFVGKLGETDLDTMLTRREQEICNNLDLPSRFGEKTTEIFLAAKKERKSFGRQQEFES